MKVLYVTRKFPPSVGGMEQAAFELYKALNVLTYVRLVSYGGPNKYLPVVYPWLFVRALLSTLVWQPDVIYLQDGVMAPMGLLLRVLMRKPIVVSIHGLEVTYENAFYKAIMKPSVLRMQQVVVGSTQTEQAVHLRYPELPLKKVTYGVSDTFYIGKPTDTLRQELAVALGLDKSALHSRKLLVTTGRLVERKGVAWFVNEVMPRLREQHPDVLYLVAGKGPDEAKIRSAIEQHAMSEHVMLLGYIPDEVRDLLYNAADYFVMPNIPVPKDMEGFGLVAVEAASCGTPVVASGIEGIIDAVVDGKTGKLLPARDANAYINTISEELTKSSFKRQAIRDYALGRFSWRRSAEGYLAVFRQTIKQKH